MECKSESGNGFGILLVFIFSFLAFASACGTFGWFKQTDHTYQRQASELSAKMSNELCRINIAMNGSAYKCN